MLKAELERYRGLLKAKEVVLTRDLRYREDIAIEKTPDVLEEGQLATLREMAIRNITRESELLRSVRAALGRMSEGTYGICAECGERIHPKRLEALPWAQLCVRCQTAADQKVETGPESDEALPPLRAQAA